VRTNSDIASCTAIKAVNAPRNVRRASVRVGTDGLISETVSAANIARRKGKSMIENIRQLKVLDLFSMRERRKNA